MLTCHPYFLRSDTFSYEYELALQLYEYVSGEVNVAQDQLPAFLKTAERLKVKGLAEAPQTIKQE